MKVVSVVGRSGLGRGAGGRVRARRSDRHGCGRCQWRSATSCSRSSVSTACGSDPPAVAPSGHSARPRSTRTRGALGSDSCFALSRRSQLRSLPPLRRRSAAGSGASTRNSMRPTPARGVPPRSECTTLRRRGRRLSACRAPRPRPTHAAIRRAALYSTWCASTSPPSSIAAVSEATAAMFLRSFAAPCCASSTAASCRTVSAAFAATTAASITSSRRAARAAASALRVAASEWSTLLRTSSAT